MFDGPTSPGIRLDASLVVLDLSAVYHSAALGILMTCAAAWLHAGLGRAGDDGVIVVVDEAWAILVNLAVARWLQSSWKLARALGVSNLAVLHRLSDLDTSGGDGVGTGRSGTRVAVGLRDPRRLRPAARRGSPGRLASRAVGHGGCTAPHLRRGVALWKVGSRSFLVEHRLSPLESAIVDTDARMEGRG